MLTQTFSNVSRPVYDADNDQHVGAIDRLVSELGMPAEVVNMAYREVLQELQKDIKVKAFLTTLVSRTVKERLSNQR